ncbi:unnamed protein product [Adineta ricciae]|uniref:Uncharacterized protein n=1 Tax=Adineta ricciae TaxID=249248 RepID=A0A815WZ59_ADIRI|nr:unnamed protein product [Adineta ricciae]
MTKTQHDKLCDINDQISSNINSDVTLKEIPVKISCFNYLKQRPWLIIVLILYAIAMITIVIGVTTVEIILLRQTTTPTTTTTIAPLICFTIPTSRPSNAWYSVGNMSITRQYYTSTYLAQDNSVLIAGGLNGISLKSTEIYNQSTGCFINGTDMPRARYYHTADILPAFPNYILLAGGVGSSGTLNVSDLFDPKTGNTLTIAMSTMRYAHGSAIFGSTQLVVIGGQGAVQLDTGDAISSGSITTFSMSLNTMIVPRLSHTVTRLGNNSGIILVAGGYQGSTYYSSTELYYGASNMFFSLGSGGAMPTARAYHTASYLPTVNKVLITGGHRDNWNTQNTMILFDVLTYSFSTLTSTMSTFRSWHTATLLPNGKVLIVGGSTGSVITPTCDVIDPSNNYLTTPVANLSFARYKHTATLLPNNDQSTVLVCGGYSPTSVPLNSCELYFV